MKRGVALIYQVFLSILVITLVSVLGTGLFARYALTSRFEEYLSQMTTGGMGPGRGVGRMLQLGTAENSFISSVDRAILFAAIAAVVVAAIAALVLARYLTRPLRHLTDGALEFAAGDLEHRVAVEGPEEVTELAEAFNHMADSLSEAERLRRRMVADVAHELRNPIAALRAQLEGVSEGVLPMDSARIDSLSDDVSRLSRLVEDLQELSVAEAGKLRYDFSPYDLASLAKGEVARAAENAKGIEVRYEGPQDAPAVIGDEFRMTQVVRNLLGNAVRHTHEGSVTVAATYDAGEARVAVTDTGEGIPDADLPYIWERFYRADSARADRTGGAGIGLAISRRIVEDHGGTVFAESVQGQGSTIGFIVPIDREEDGSESG